MSKKPNSMFAEVRQQEICALLRNQGKVTVSELCARFSVSQATIRTDLNELESQGKLKRTHGGAITVGTATLEPTTNEKKAKNVAAKIAIAKEAVKYIQPNCAIAIDTGTTMLELARLIAQVPNLIVVTNDVEIALQLEQNSGANVFLLGGTVRSQFHCTVGSSVTDALSNMHVDTLFLATNGLSLENGLSTPSVEVASIKRKLIDVSNRVVLLADKSKLQNDSFAYFATLADVDVLISDADLHDELNRSPEGRRIEFVHVQVESSEN